MTADWIVNARDEYNRFCVANNINPTDPNSGAQYILIKKGKSRGVLGRALAAISDAGISREHPAIQDARRQYNDAIKQRPPPDQPTKRPSPSGHITDPDPTAITTARPKPKPPSDTPQQTDTQGILLRMIKVLTQHNEQLIQILRTIQTPPTSSQTNPPTHTPASEPTLDSKLKHRIYGRQEGRCAGCQVAFNYANLAPDYRIPIDQGGRSDSSNIQLLCLRCNAIKGKNSMAHLVAQLKTADHR